MEKDTQLTHHLYWLWKSLNAEFKDKEYKEIINTNTKQNKDICKDVDDLVTYIKETY